VAQRFAVTLSVLFFAGPTALVLAGGTNTATESLGKVRLADSACYFLSSADGEVGHGHKVEREEIFDGCIDGSCWSEYRDPETESEKCAYGRSANLTLGRTRTAKPARQIVRDEIRKGYSRKVKVGADLAGMRVTRKGGGIVMAVGRTTVVFALTAASDNDSDPIWIGVKPELKDDARLMVERLRQPGCPISLENCH
jgi:hypothetical protein